VANVRALARAHYWDGAAIVHVQDDYVAQWGWSDSTVHPHGHAVDAHEQRISLQRVGRQVARGYGCVD
jgi:peptidylprolyl isomerase